MKLRLNPLSKSNKARGNARFSPFRRDEEGAVTVEAALWMPFFILFLFGIGELSFVFHGQARMLEIAQDANRGFSVGRFASTTEASEWALQALRPFSDEIIAQTMYNPGDGIIYTGISIPASDLAGNIGIFSMLSSFDVEVVAQQVLEY